MGPERHPFKASISIGLLGDLLEQWKVALVGQAEVRETLLDAPFVGRWFELELSGTEWAEVILTELSIVAQLVAQIDKGGLGKIESLDGHQ